MDTKIELGEPNFVSPQRRIARERPCLPKGNNARPGTPDVCRWRGPLSSRSETRMSAIDTRPHDGGCTCRHVRYRMTTRPLFVHCCHCRWCQRETGAVVRAQRDDRGRPRRAAAGRRSIRRHAVEQRQRPEDRALPELPSRASGATTRAPATRCASCASARSTSPTACRRTSISSPHRNSPGSCFPPGTPAVPEYYKASERWPQESLERRAVLLAARAAREAGSARS